jgi:hypothetical protein
MVEETRKHIDYVSTSTLWVYRNIKLPVKVQAQPNPAASLQPITELLPGRRWLLPDSSKGLGL